MDKTALEALVGQVADEFTARLKRGEQPDVEEYAQAHPEVGDLLRGILPTLEALHPDDADSEQYDDSPSPLELVKGCLGDYRIIREIGRGGMGIVYEAEQISLVRQVALKVLPFAAALDEKRLQRFKHEAQAAAHLHHTNIVPVFAIGCERGVHFYAMQYIAGQSLAEVIRELRQCSGRGSAKEPVPRGPRSQVSSSLFSGRWAQSQDNAVPSASALAEPVAETRTQWSDTLANDHSGTSPHYFRTIARLGIQAAEALEYAHSRGVIHRDIKPANLLVDVLGNLWITDFGMAQFRRDAELTQSGDLLGTLRYMSPEQASAKPGLLDHRTDIYSLGASLYELSTLEAAFNGQDREELLRQITAEAPAQPRKLDPSMPRDFETIILKTIAKTPDERYGSTRELADDLRRFLDDKPIFAKRPSLLERVAKWCRRHKALVRALGAGLVISAVTLAVSTVMVWQAKQRTEDAYLAEAKHRRRARQAVNEMYTQFAEKWLATEPQMEEVQREFLLKALRFYEEEAEEQARDAPERYERALAYKRVADIQLKLGNDAAASLAYERAIALLEELVDAFPGGPDCRLDLARCNAAWGGLALQTGRTMAAEMAHRQAVLLAEQLSIEYPSDARCRVALVVFHVGLGVALYNLGRTEEAEACYRQALPVAEQLVRENAEEPIYRHRLAGVLQNWAQLARTSGHVARAEVLYRRTLVILDRLKTDLPGNPAYVSAWAGLSRLLGELLLEDGRLADAEKCISPSVDALEEITGKYPKIAGFREEVAAAWLCLGRVHQANARHDEAEKSFKRCVTLYEALCVDRPTRTAYQSILAELFAEFAVKSLRNPLRAVELAKMALEVEPQSSRLWVTLGVAYYRQDEWNAAADALEMGLRQNPADTGRGTFYLAMTCARLGDHERARRSYELAKDWMDKHQPRHPGLASLRSEAGEVLKACDLLRLK
jgi:serine/threonine protein kinase/tetratricopeptide (TPR) repeat protein